MVVLKSYNPKWNERWGGIIIRVLERATRQH